jgi:hypothetical protein
MICAIVCALQAEVRHGSEEQARNETEWITAAAMEEDREEECRQAEEGD